MNWILYIIADIAFSIICYLTNWLVIFFADEYGNLPKCLRWWQTYDNCLDVDFIAKEVVPKIFRYDFDKHYIYYPEVKDGALMIPGYVKIIDPEFTLRERVQRYFCRLWWLYRNTGYGFAYEVCGRDYDKYDVKTYRNYENSKQDACYIGIVKDNRNVFTKTWSFYYCNKYCKWVYIRIYLGWKIKGLSGRAMIAFHINPFRLAD